MSYLGPLRLHFFGKFQADVSTINNDVRHYDNTIFQQSMQSRQKNTGSAAFRLVDCRVTMVGYADGSTSRRDPVVGLSIADATARVSAKTVDLDPQQQLVSEIWGLLVRLTDGVRDYFSGSYAVAAFSDLWDVRALQSGADVGSTAFYQSVIGPVTWGEDARRSRFLRELRDASPARLLSIKFNVDGYNMDPNSANVTLGRIVGTIGPASPDEPRQFVAGRHLLPLLKKTQPAVKMNFMPAAVDEKSKRVYADFGNSLPTAQAGGALEDIGTLELGWLDRRRRFHTLGEVDYLEKNWYPQTAGVQAFPRHRELTRGELRALRRNRLVVMQNGAPIVQENFGGLHARADQFVYRLNPGESAKVEIFVTRYGQPLAGARLTVFHDSSGLQPGVVNKNIHLPPPRFGVPKRAIRFARRVKTNRHGRATLKIKAHDPGNPRGYIDGQVYGIRYVLEELRARVEATDWTFGWNPSDFLSVLVFDTYEAPARPTWHELQPIFSQYRNLYPVMNHVIDLADFDHVVANAHLLSFAFSLPPHDPNHMPVTRDLSQGKLAAILRFLARPRRGRLRPISLPFLPAAVDAAIIAAERLAGAAADGVTPEHGSKAFAMHTRGRVEDPRAKE